MAKERVTTLADKLSLMFKQSLDQFAASAKTVANEKSVIGYLNSKNIQDSIQTIDFLKNFEKKDTANKQIQLLNAAKKPVLSWPNGALTFKPNIDVTNRSLQDYFAYVGVGKITQLKGLMYFPVLARISANNKTIGYVVNWKILRATQESIDQLAQLLGSNGRVYFGNDDNDFWTNLLKPVDKPPVDLKKLQQTTLYSRSNGESLIGTMRPLANSRWLVLVELSSEPMLKTAHTFLNWLIIIGSILVIVGGLGGWLMSRSITGPLRKFNNAAASIAEGNYALSIDYDRPDELGNLAQSFNLMAMKIQSSQQTLVQEVKDKAKQLETAQTDIKYQEENLKKKDEFISIASHELKTPLTTIKAFFQIAENEIPSDYKSHNLITRMGRQVSRMEQLISDLIDVSKINLNYIHYNTVCFDFDSVMQDVLHNLQQISPKHQLILEKSVSVKINGDPNRIEQAIGNVLDNAIKFSPQGGKVIISSEVERGRLKVVIKDFGIGISEDMMDLLFERFSRANADYRFQGLGLGLFISAEIIKGHGGLISVKSKLGQGAEFTIQLPIAINSQT